MAKRLLFGTTNPAKLQQMRALLAPLPLHLLSPTDIGLQLQVVEDGVTPADNATIKAKAYWAAAGMPTLAVDVGLLIDALPPAQQPGAFVRRFRGATVEATDAEMLAYYQQTLAAVGGQSGGQWLVAVVLAPTPDRLLCETFTLATHFTSVPSQARVTGEPLASLQIDRNTGQYYAERSAPERLAIHAGEAQNIFNFVQQHLYEW